VEIERDRSGVSGIIHMVSKLKNKHSSELNIKSQLKTLKHEFMNHFIYRLLNTHFSIQCRNLVTFAVQQFAIKKIPSVSHLAGYMLPFK